MTVQAVRGSAVVLIDLGAVCEEPAASLAGVLDRTPDDVLILVCGDRMNIAEAADGRVVVVPSVEEALALSAPADVAVVSSSCIVADGWLAALRDATYADARTATASPICTVELAARAASHFDEAAATVLSASARTRPRLRGPSRLCMFVRRSAIELVGGFTSIDEASNAGRFADRCLQRGLLHVLADDVLVSSATDSVSGSMPRKRSGPVARAIGHARRAASDLTVIVDARMLGSQSDGTAVHVLELLGALGRHDRIDVTGIVSSQLGTDARRLLGRLSGVKLVSESGAGGAPRADIVHRPFQVSAPADLSTLARLGDRLVITHQDLISFHNPFYFPSPEAWEGYRSLTRDALSLADGVVFFSEHVRTDALAEDLVQRDRATVIRIGVDHAAIDPFADATAPPGVELIRDGVEVILCLGTDFWHKNRMFALRLVDELRSRHGWGGVLVLAGARARFGSSLAEEQHMLAAAPDLASAVVRLPAVSGAEKTWLLGRADLVIYPSVHEGFGLVPFEAADHDVPCLWAAGTALSELLPASAAGIVPWNVAKTAHQALTLLRDAAARANNIQLIRAAARDLRWDDTADQLVRFYGEVCDASPSVHARRSREGGVMQPALSEDAVRLVGPAGALPRNVERPLLALATHPRVAGPVFSALRAGYRLTQLRRGRRSD